jgi:hypothetical protein
MRKIFCAVFICIMLSGCNTGVAFSILGDLVKLRIDREASGQDHIEDVFKEEE